MKFTQLPSGRYFTWGLEEFIKIGEVGIRLSDRTPVKFRDLQVNVGIPLRYVPRFKRFRYHDLDYVKGVDLFPAEIVNTTLVEYEG